MNDIVETKFTEKYLEKKVTVLAGNIMSPSIKNITFCFKKIISFSVM